LVHCMQIHFVWTLQGWFGFWSFWSWMILCMSMSKLKRLHRLRNKCILATCLSTLRAFGGTCVSISCHIGGGFMIVSLLWRFGVPVVQRKNTFCDGSKPHHFGG
jgi:hypothetical protein